MGAIATRPRARRSWTSPARPTSAESWRCPTRGCIDSGAISPRRCAPASRRTRSSTPASRCSTSSTATPPGSSSSCARCRASRSATSRRWPRSSTSPSTRQCATSGVPPASSRMILATHHPHLQCTSYDLPVVVPIAERTIAAAGLSDRVTAASGDFFAEPLPEADVITMGLILHDWNLDRKMHLIRSAYDALPEGGAFIVIENLIDDARRENAFGLMMSLNMLIEFGDAFDYTGSDFAGWCREVGFRDVEILPLTGPGQRRHRLQVAVRPGPLMRCRDRVDGHYMRPRYFCALAVAFALAHLVVAIAYPGSLATGWLINASFVSAALLCLWRAASSRSDRAAWLCIGAGLLCQAFGDRYYKSFLADAANVSQPSVADFGYLAFYPLAACAIVLLLRTRLRVAPTRARPGRVGRCARGVGDRGRARTSGRADDLRRRSRGRRHESRLSDRRPDPARPAGGRYARAEGAGRPRADLDRGGAGPVRGRRHRLPVPECGGFL